MLVRDPIEDVTTVNSHSHTRRAQGDDFAPRGPVEQWRIVSRPCHGHIARARVDHEVKHADKHVLLDVGIHAAVDRAQHFGRGGGSLRRTAEQAAAHAGYESGGNSFARDVGDDNAPAMFVELQVVEIVSADLAGGDIQAAHFVACDPR